MHPYHFNYSMMSQSSFLNFSKVSTLSLPKNEGKSCTDSSHYKFQSFSSEFDISGMDKTCLECSLYFLLSDNQSLKKLYCLQGLKKAIDLCTSSDLNDNHLNHLFFALPKLLTFFINDDEFQLLVVGIYSKLVQLFPPTSFFVHLDTLKKLLQHHSISNSSSNYPLHQWNQNNYPLFVLNELMSNSTLTNFLCATSLDTVISCVSAVYQFSAINSLTNDGGSTVNIINVLSILCKVYTFCPPEICTCTLYFIQITLTYSMIHTNTYTPT